MQKKWHTVQKLRVISNKCPKTFDSFFSLYGIVTYKKTLKYWNWTDSFWVAFLEGISYFWIWLLSKLEYQFKLRENHLEKIKIQRKKADIRKEKGDIIKKIVELEIKLVNYKTELQKLTNETKIDTLQNLMEKLA